MIYERYLRQIGKSLPYSTGNYSFQLRTMGKLLNRTGRWIIGDPMFTGEPFVTDEKFPICKYEVTIVLAELSEPNSFDQRVAALLIRPEDSPNLSEVSSESFAPLDHEISIDSGMIGILDFDRGQGSLNHYFERASSDIQKNLTNTWSWGFAGDEPHVYFSFFCASGFGDGEYPIFIESTRNQIFSGIAVDFLLGEVDVSIEGCPPLKVEELRTAGLQAFQGRDYKLATRLLGEILVYLSETERRKYEYAKRQF